MSILRIGVIGYGFIAKVHIANIIKFSYVKITSVFSRTKKSVNGLNDFSFYLDYKEMIKREQLDTVIIATPTYTHREITCYCADQGINIFLEKPMAITLEECDAIIDSINENKIKFFVGHVLRFWSTYGSVKSYLISHYSKIGDIHSIIAKRLGSFPRRIWFADQSKSGGVILDLSIHDIDYASWILGNVESVSCKASKLSKYGMEVFGESTTNLNFKKNKIAKCEASWAKPADFQFYTYTQIKGSERTIELDADKIYNDELLGIKNIFKSDNGYYNQMKHFLDVILNKNNKFLVSAKEGKEAVKICLAAINSAENNGKEIYTDEIN